MSLGLVSLFSGVGGFDLGLEQAGFTTQFQAEWDEDASAVLARHWPDVPRWGDVQSLSGAHILRSCASPDLIAWGSPCQDLSVAGRRTGLAGEQSRLFYEGMRIIREMREESHGRYPVVSIWENVSGALNSNGGADFGEVLDQMAEARALVIEWALLDARYFGVAQRRRRVFVIAVFDPDLASRCADPLLPVATGLYGHPEESRPPRGGDPSAPESRLASDRSDTGSVISSAFRMRAFGNYVGDETASAIKARDFKDSTDLIVEAPPMAFDTNFGSNASVMEDVSPPLKSTQRPPSVTQPRLWDEPLPSELDRPVFFQAHQSGDARIQNDVAPTLAAYMGTGGNNTPMVASPDLTVRRLTPLECERLMGWPDDWTRWRQDGGEQTDGHRYRQIGNGVASPVARWIGGHLRPLMEEDR